MLRIKINYIIPLMTGATCVYNVTIREDGTIVVHSGLIFLYMNFTIVNGTKRRFSVFPEEDR